MNVSIQKSWRKSSCFLSPTHFPSSSLFLTPTPDNFRMPARYANCLRRTFYSRRQRFLHQLTRTETTVHHAGHVVSLCSNTGSISPKLRALLPIPAQRMIDQGVLDKIAANASTSELAKQHLLKCETTEERHETMVSLSFLVNAHRLNNTACEKCLYQRNRCVCSALTPVMPQHNLWVFQHVGEFGRGNNTGGLLCLLAGAKRSTRGIREEQDRMMNHIENNLASSVVLFPSEDSVTIQQYQKAKNMDRFIPDIVPRVRLGGSKTKSWLDPIRRQTEEHRVCTAQAAAMMLRELGDDKSGGAIEGAVREVVRLAVS